MKKTILLLLLLCGCPQGGEIDPHATQAMTRDLSQGVRFMRLPQLNNVCIGYAWMGENDKGGPLVFTVPCEAQPQFPAPCVTIQAEAEQTAVQK